MKGGLAVACCVWWQHAVGEACAFQVCSAACSVLLTQGLLASWGDNDSGQLGTGTTASDRPQHTPKLLRGSSSSSGGADGGGGSGSSGSSSSMRNCFVRAAAGEAFSVAANSSGRCFTFGQVGRAGLLVCGGDQGADTTGASRTMSTFPRLARLRP